LVTGSNLGDLNKMKFRKEWIGFVLCLGVLLILTIILSFMSRRQFHHQVITSVHKLMQSELYTITQDTSLRLLDRDLALFDLGLPEISSDSRELLKEIIIDTLTLPTVTEAFAYSEKGLPIKLEIGFKENIEAVNFASKEFSSEPYFKNKAGEDFSFFFRIETLEGTFITEILIDEQHILNEWRAVDRQLLTFSLLSFCCVVIVLFLIFYFMIRGIRNREIRLEQGNQLLQRTNQKLAQAYKKVGLGALSGHLMHSLKTPLTHLQMIAREAEEKREVDVKELQKIHLNIRELVSESLQALKEFENQKVSYQVTISELFDQVIERTYKLFPNAQILVPKNKALNQNIDNLQSTLLLPILTAVIDNAYEQDSKSEVNLSAKLEDDKLTIKISDTSGGIPVNEQPFLFDPSKSSKKGGTGLGLAIAYHLAQSMEAELTLSQSDQCGSIFKILFKVNELHA
jgi:signal transduction histidine kinase